MLLSLCYIFRFYFPESRQALLDSDGNTEFVPVTDATKEKSSSKKKNELIPPAAKTTSNVKNNAPSKNNEGGPGSKDETDPIKRAPKPKKRFSHSDYDAAPNQIKKRKGKKNGNMNKKVSKLW